MPEAKALPIMQYRKCERHNRFHWGSLCPVCVAVDEHPEEEENIERALSLRDALRSEITSSLIFAAKQAELLQEKEVAAMLYGLASLIGLGLEQPVAAIIYMLVQQVADRGGVAQSDSVLPKATSPDAELQSTAEGDDLDEVLRNL